MSNSVIKTEKLVEAVEILQELCIDQGDDCLSCPMSEEGECLINNDLPEDWNIKRPDNKVLTR